jgi:glycosyltransferase involved in cell wall biosynthesis
VADVNVEQAGGGALLLHRLLKEYPVDRLAVVYNPDHSVGDPANRLPGVRYRPFCYAIPRLIRNRFNPFWPALQARHMRTHAKAIMAMLADFRPEAVLTVPHWYLWFSAAEVARRLTAPLHLIVHDDWPSYTTFRKPGRLWDLVRWTCRRAMRPIYRQAVSRLCVSPGMVEACRAWYGPDGDLLYPSRGEDSPRAQVRVRPDRSGPPVVAFCGQIHQDGTTDLLRGLARVLTELGGRLDIYSLLSAEDLAARGLKAPTVRVLGFLPADVMGQRVGETADALFLPASFEERERHDVSTLFPSKLADYTAIGLPILVWGPRYSSAVRWSEHHPETTVLVTDPDPSGVRSALTRLIADPAEARRLASSAAAAGDACFHPDAARKILYRGLRAGRAGQCP